MGHRKITRMLVLIFSALFIGGLIINNTFSIGLCAESDYNCDLLWGEGLALPLWFGSLTVLIILGLLYFRPQEVFNSWKKFAIWAIPLGAIFIAISPVSCEGGLGAFTGVCFWTKEIATWWLSGLFFLISLLIILVKSLKLRRQGR